MNETALVNNENALFVKKIISAQIEALRIARGCRTIKDLSDEIGVIRYETFNSYATGRAEPKAVFFRAMFDFGINVDWLLTGEGEMYRANRADHVRVSYSGTGVAVNSLLDSSGVRETSRDSAGRGSRICQWVQHYVETHSADECAWLEVAMAKEFPDFAEWKKGQGR